MKVSECEYCGGLIHQKKVAIEHWYEGELVIVKDVPVGVCGDCGERYYEATTLDKLDATAKRRESARERMSVAIMTLNP